MKIQKLFLAVAVALGGAPVFAFDGTINIAGKVLDQTCRVNTNIQNIAVKQSDVNMATPDGANKMAGARRFTITLDSCRSDNNTITTFFEPGANIVGGRLKNAATNDAAQNVTSSVNYTVVYN